MENHRGARGAEPRAWVTHFMPKERPMLTTIQIAGLQTYGYHGLFEEERSLGQKFIFDIEAELQPVETRSEEHTSELQSLMRISYAVFCLTKKNSLIIHIYTINSSLYMSSLMS